MSSEGGVFDNVMTDVSGKIRLDSEDPRWIQLFCSQTSAHLARNADVSWFGNRLIENNTITGNMVQLVEQTVTRLQQVSSRRTAPTAQLTENCCTALYLTTLLIHHMIVSLSPDELVRHLFLPEFWSSQQDFSQAIRTPKPSTGNMPVSSIGDGKVMEGLIYELCAVIDSPISGSTQLYAPPKAESQQWAGLNGPCDLFLNFLYSHGEQQLRIALGSIQSNSNTFSSCMAVQLVRGLLRCAVDEEAPLNAAYAAGSNSSSRLSLALDPAPRPIIYSSTLLKDFLRQYNRTGSYHGLNSHSKPFPIPTEGYLGQAVQMVFNDLLRVLPFGLLRRWFATADVSYDSTIQQLQTQSLCPTASLSPSDLLSSGSSQENNTWDQSQLPPMVVPVPGAMHLPADPLGERALNLLLVLLHNRHSTQPGRPNPFREAFGLLHDQSLQLQHSTSDLPPTVFGDEEGGIAEEEGEFAGTGRVSEGMIVMNASRIHLPFIAIIEAVGRGLPGESHALLLYSLLQSQATFTDTLLKTGTLPYMLCACMRSLYCLTAKPKKCALQNTGKDTGSKGSDGTMGSKLLNQLYVLVVCILILVQDGAVVQAMCRTEVPMLWYKERQLQGASLMDTSVLCIIRCVMHALFRLRDPYLLSNSCAILHNLSSGLFCELLPYTAERLVRVTCQLCARAAKEEAARSAMKKMSMQMFDPRHVESGSRSVACATQNRRCDEELALMPEAIGTLMQVLDTALRPQRLRKCVQVLYALLHESHSVEESFMHPVVQTMLDHLQLPSGLLKGIVQTTQHYLVVVESLVGVDNAGKFTAAQTIELIKKHIAIAEAEEHCDRQQPLPSHDFLNAVPRKKYSYQEAENAEEFFLPNIWAAVLRSSPEVPWQLLQLTLVDPLSAGLLQLDRAPIRDEEDVDSDNSMSLSYSASITNSVDQV